MDYADGYFLDWNKEYKVNLPSLPQDVLTAAATLFQHNIICYHTVDDGELNTVTFTPLVDEDSDSNSGIQGEISLLYIENQQLYNLQPSKYLRYNTTLL